MPTFFQDYTVREYGGHGPRKGSSIDSQCKKKLSLSLSLFFFCNPSNNKRNAPGVDWDSVRLKHFVIRQVFPNVSKERPSPPYYRKRGSEQPVPTFFRSLTVDSECCLVRKVDSRQLGKKVQQRRTTRLKVSSLDLADPTGSCSTRFHWKIRLAKTC